MKYLIFEPQKRHLQHSEGSFNIKLPHKMGHNYMAVFHLTNSLLSPYGKLKEKYLQKYNHYGHFTKLRIVSNDVQYIKAVSPQISCLIALLSL